VGQEQFDLIMRLCWSATSFNLLDQLNSLESSAGGASGAVDETMTRTSLESVFAEAAPHAMSPGGASSDVNIATRSSSRLMRQAHFWRCAVSQSYVSRISGERKTS
jgi:hypothetical protein